jgi:hypothetical protein
MKRLAFAMLVLAACDPVWGVQATLHDPADRPIADATIAVACADGSSRYGTMAARSAADGTVWVGGLGTVFPPGCDVYVAKPGFRTQHIRYRDLCPGGAGHCDRAFSYELVLVPE